MQNKTLLIFLIAMVVCKPLFSQVKHETVFKGAQAILKSYKALYFIDDSEDKKIRATIRNINNALDDPRIKGKVTIEFIAFGDGVEMFKIINHYDTLLLALKKRGVILAQCLNTLKERNIQKQELVPFINYVPTGNGEIIIRQQQGWAVIHP